MIWKYSSSNLFFLVIVVLHVLTSWYGNYKYRLKFRITNTGEAESYAAVDITFDTTLHIPTDIRPDCGDIEFTTVDGEFPIRFWLESGCNTQSTSFWLEIPSLANGDTDIYMYFSDDEIDPNSIQTRMMWEARFGFFWGDTSGCEDDSNLKSFKAVNNGSYFIQGSPHQDFFLSQGSQSGVYVDTWYADNFGNIWTEGLCDGRESFKAHRHSIFFEFDSLSGPGMDGPSNHPEYYEFEFCLSPERHLSSIPAGSVVMFPSTETIVDGFEEFSFPNVNRDYYIRSGVRTGGYSDLQTHRHDVDYHSDSTWVESNDLCGAYAGNGDTAGTDDWVATPQHQHLKEDCPTDSVLTSPRSHSLHFRKATHDTKFSNGMITYQHCTPNCPDTMNTYTTQRNDEIHCYCENWWTITGSGDVYGIDIYRSDSHVCRAALHAGRTIPGMIRVKMGDPLTAYGTLFRNGVSSIGIGSVGNPCPANASPYRGWGYTFWCYCPDEGSGNVYANGQGVNLFVDESSICMSAKFMGIEFPTILRIDMAFAHTGVCDKTSNNGVNAVGFDPQMILDCPATAEAYRGLDGEWRQCFCSIEATEAGAVSGTWLFTDNSDICRAAKHSGVRFDLDPPLDPPGAWVRFIIRAGSSNFIGTTQNDVTTSSYAPVWPGTFEVYPAYWMYWLSLSWSSSFEVLEPEIEDEFGSSSECEDPPFGWNRYEDLDDRFLRQTRTESVVQSSTVGYSHRHIFTCTSGSCAEDGINSEERGDSASTYQVASSDHTHLINGALKDTLYPEELDPRHKYLRFIQRIDTSHLSFINSFDYEIKCGSYANVDVGFVCNGNGNCTSPDVCECNANWEGSEAWECDTTFCDGIPSNMSESVCSGHGTCTAPETCDCDSDWMGDSYALCDTTQCDKIRSDDDDVCTGHGTCYEKDYCTCLNENYYPGEGIGFCQNWECYGVLNSAQEVCNFQNGSCYSFNNCTCNVGYYGSECEIWECNSFLFNDTENVCFGHGECHRPGICACDDGYYTPELYCGLWNCNGTIFSDSEVCSRRGNCTNPDDCDCDEHYYPNGNGICDMYQCFSIEYSDPEVCNYQNGSCNSYNNCTCNDGYFGVQCELWKCDGKLYNDTDVCYGRGRCLYPDECLCDEFYFPEGNGFCQHYNCYGIQNDHPSVCYYQNGTCSSHNNCSSCNEGYYGNECELYECNGLLFNDSNVCSRRGRCLFPDFCSCDQHYFPSGPGVSNICQDFECYGIGHHEFDVCSYQNGTCDSHDNCTCNDNYFGDECQLFECNGLLYNDTEVCSGRGTCILADFCDCDEHYYDSGPGIGNNCQHYECNGIQNDHLSVCNFQNGSCDSYNNCTCEGGYFGDECELFVCGNPTFKDDFSDPIFTSDNWINYGSYGSVSDSCTSYSSPNALLITSPTMLCPRYVETRKFTVLNGSTSYYEISFRMITDAGSCEHADPNEHVRVYLITESSKLFLMDVTVDIYNWDTLHTIVGSIGEDFSVRFEQQLCSGVVYDEWALDDVAVNYTLTNHPYCVSGSCIAPSYCECQDGYSGTRCDYFECNSLPYYDSLACGGHGNCVSPDFCDCDTGYLPTGAGGICNDWNCGGISKNNVSLVCSVHGECIAPENCNCEVDYFPSGSFGICDDWLCGGVSRKLTHSVCYGHGECTSPEMCICETNYYPGGYGQKCHNWLCDGISRLSSSQVCSAHGVCSSHNNCTCEIGYYPSGNWSWCEKWDCDSVLYSNPNACYGNGECLGPEKCVCDLNYYNESDFCKYYDCYEKRWDNGDVCNYMNGSCVDHNSCNCTIGYYGNECENWVCDEILYSDSEVCHGRGSCIAPDECSCDDHYYDQESFCVWFDCFGKKWDEQSVCNHHNGSCDSYNNCTCRDGYFGDECQLWTCNGTLFNESGVCNGHGRCVFHDDCSCDEHFYSPENFCMYYDCFGTRWDDPSVCDGNYQGVCSSYNNCSCFNGYFGLECEMWKCDVGTHLHNDSNVCSRHGDCIAPENCSCVDEYYGTMCEKHDCYGIPMDDPSVCNFMNGTCSTPDNCTSCLDGYHGEECEIATCGGYLPNHTFVCSGHGTCQSGEWCICDFGYSPGGGPGKICGDYSCFGHHFNSLEVCNFRNGSCVSYNNCSFCRPGYYGLECDVWDCHEIKFNDSDVCSSHGNCVSPNRCECDENYRDQTCDMYDCFDIPHNLSSVCSFGNGTCDSYNNCTCQENYFGERCHMYTCLGNLFNESSVCSAHGKCVLHDVCSCYDNYDHMNDVGECDQFACFGILKDDDSVCNHLNGTCIDHDNCSCIGQFYGSKCDDWDCNGVSRKSIDEVCTGHGTCVKPEVCDCLENYNHSTSSPENSNDCGLWRCFGRLKNDIIQVPCSGHGFCISHDECECFLVNNEIKYNGSECEEFKCFDVSLNDDDICGSHGQCFDSDSCGCDRGYEKQSGEEDGECVVWSCGKFFNYENTTCSGRGKCTASHTCDCNDGFEGDDCETWKCGLYFYDDSLVCEGRGVCDEPGKCTCETGFKGDFCETNLYYYTVMAPLLSVFGLASGGVIVSVVVLVLCCVCCSALLCCFAMIILASIVIILRLKVQKFRKLKNFDILMKEQELEEDSNIAHLRVNSKLFEVKYTDLKVLGILGEGGSSSVVYKASWKSQIVAFKCFKTRMICSSQDVFDEFEREVEILSSVAHPGILQFYGCTMDPPRVGIIMEFCPNGDLAVFYSEQKPKYPFFKKLRHIWEVCDALDYLHERNIIHRDIKLENILVDVNFCTKLMDFGLSRIVSEMDGTNNMTAKIGTSFYMAPEVITSKYDSKADVFSMGILMFIIATEMFCDPYADQEGMSIENIEMKVAHDPNCRPTIGLIDKLVKFKKKKKKEDDDGKKKENNEDYKEEEKNYSDLSWLKDLIVSCWQHDPKARPSVRKVCEIVQEHMSKYENVKEILQIQEEEENEKDKNKEINQEELNKIDINQINVSSSEEGSSDSDTCDLFDGF